MLGTLGREHGIPFFFRGETQSLTSLWCQASVFVHVTASVKYGHVTTIGSTEHFLADFIIAFVAL